MCFGARFPMDCATGDGISYTLLDFCHDFGKPEHLTFDGAMAQKGVCTLFMKTIRKYNIDFHLSSPRRPNEQPAEGCIHIIKTRWYRIMMKRNVPLHFWDYRLVWIFETCNISVSSLRYANGCTPLEIITGETPDVSEYTDFGFYDWVTYQEKAGLGELSLGRWLGVSHKVGNLMSYWICTPSCVVISCVMVQRLTYAEQKTYEWNQRMQAFDESIKKRLDAKGKDISLTDVPAWNSLSPQQSK